MCPQEHYERGTELSFGRGQGPWKLSGCFNALSCNLTLSFISDKHSDKKTHTVDPILGVGDACCAPWIRHCVCMLRGASYLSFGLVLSAPATQHTDVYECFHFLEITKILNCSEFPRTLCQVTCCT